jgi:hypothetical protein
MFIKEAKTRRSASFGIQATLKELCKTIQHGMLTSCVVLLHDVVHLHATADTLALLEDFIWELLDYLPEELVDITTLQQ